MLQSKNIIKECLLFSVRFASCLTVHRLCPALQGPIIISLHTFVKFRKYLKDVDWKNKTTFAEDNFSFVNSCHICFHKSRSRWNKLFSDLHHYHTSQNSFQYPTFCVIIVWPTGQNVADYLSSLVIDGKQIWRSEHKYLQIVLKCFGKSDLFRSKVKNGILIPLFLDATALSCNAKLSG